MRGRLYLILPVVLTLGLLTAGGQAQTAGEEDKGASKAKKSNSFFNRFSLIPGKRAETEKPAKKAELKAEAKQQPQGNQVISSAPNLKQEMEKYLEREAVCLKLIAIADHTGDEKLRRMAENLQQLAWDTYLKRTAQFGSATAGKSTDEAILQSHLKNAGPLPGQGGVPAGARTGSKGPIAARKEKQ